MGKKIIVREHYQQTYAYELTAPQGKNFDPEFTPELTPQEMLSLGVFNGYYFLGTIPKEFPALWFAKAKVSDHPNPELNFFKISASQPLAIWQAKGWICQDDPLGWFQWYCRYYFGRRHPDDARQINRWKAIARHIGQIKKNCYPGDLMCRRKQRQALLHWARDARKY
ncbi:MAG: hypothetical protein H6502_04815 [Candidatus Woesearchaeota archaeon]|nr:MAG: hypothetical protein H6502_04815 [Candidatus Woesearchaeota archaeon]